MHRLQMSESLVDRDLAPENTPLPAAVIFPTSDNGGASIAAVEKELSTNDTSFQGELKNFIRKTDPINSLYKKQKALERRNASLKVELETERKRRLEETEDLKNLLIWKKITAECCICLKNKIIRFIKMEE